MKSPVVHEILTILYKESVRFLVTSMEIQMYEKICSLRDFATLVS